MYLNPIHTCSLCILIWSILLAYVFWSFPSFQLRYPDPIYPTSLCILFPSILPAYVSWSGSYPSYQFMDPDPIYSTSLCILILSILPAYVSWFILPENYSTSYFFYNLNENSYQYLLLSTKLQSLYLRCTMYNVHTWYI